MTNQNGSHSKEESSGSNGQTILEALWEGFKDNNPQTSMRSEPADKYLFLSGACCMYNLLMETMRRDAPHIAKVTLQVRDEFNTYFRETFKSGDGPLN
jgi:hypothetical protein